ncbi:MAG: DUF4268 domain-containing protein [Deltaproteobacteria bacterium]|uniref:DUF4268 domain-containing protein n=1 Tax=Candidatus Zymogenus saltonus TaxID=2844893 RepID=A0A9D8KFC0_9DELT|nr:DUF4268 domain-containing protein [Candidatus Zymogenus saltonus]
MTEIGEIKKLGSKKIKEIWPNERDLSNWIAKHIELLNDLLNTQIEIEGIEVPAQNFFIDLMGTDKISQVPVIIENQFGKSDHDHLGKLITYSSVKEAGIAILISNEIQYAHRKAINWQNQITPDDMTFYGVELELLQIDDSKPAPYFRIVAEPPPRKSKPPIDKSPKNIRYQAFFDKLRKKLLEKNPNFTRAKALYQSWWSLGIGRAGFILGVNFTIDDRFRVEIYIDTGNKEFNEKAFEALKENRVYIEKEIGNKLEWDRLTEKRACRIYLPTKGSIDDSEEELDKLINWGCPLLIKFKEVFGPLVKNVQLD